MLEGWGKIIFKKIFAWWGILTGDPIEGWGGMTGRIEKQAEAIWDPR